MKTVYFMREFARIISGQGRGMREWAEIADKKPRNQIKSIILVSMIVCVNVIIIVPISIPTVKALGHLASTIDEDGVYPYDADGLKNLVVVWAPDTSHEINGVYTVDPDYTLSIPALVGDAQLGDKISMGGGAKIDVFGTLITNSHENSSKRTWFYGGNWEGIHFQPGSEGNITECYFVGAENALLFDAYIDPPLNSRYVNLLSPGIVRSQFAQMGSSGITMYGVNGYRNIEDIILEDNYMSTINFKLFNTDINISKVIFYNHKLNRYNLLIQDSNVKLTNSMFMASSVPGNAIRILGNSNGTVIDKCEFFDQAPGDFYIRVDGTSPLIDNCSFDFQGGENSVWANEKNGVPAHPRIRNPTSDRNPGFWDDTFDNTTINVTGSSSATIQWYMNVVAIDPFGNIIKNAPVWVVNRTDDPADPSCRYTDEEGWAKWITVTEMTMFNDSIEYFSSFNISALNNSMIGYVEPEVLMNMSKEIAVYVPFNPKPNTIPFVSYLPTPSGVQGGLITIEYMLEDPDMGDDGNLSIEVFFSLNGFDWKPATQGPGGDATNKLFNDTLHYFIWESASDLFDYTNESIYIMIIPYDRAGPGTPRQTGNFTLDNIIPKILSGPVITPTNITCLIEWTVDEIAQASVWWGFYNDGSLNDLKYETVGSSGSMNQSVILTGLTPGLLYTIVVNSTDADGNTGSSWPLNLPYTFRTPILIQLYMGWNMISFAPYPLNTAVLDQLSSISGDYDAVQMYDAADPADPWKHYVPGKSMGNDLTDIYPDFGIWIKMNKDAVLNVTHMIPPKGDPPMPIFIEYGWNFIGYPSVKTRSVNEALLTVVWDKVQTYDAASGKWYHSDGYNGETDTLLQMELGRGYWLHCPAPSGDNWTISYR
jgi:hypothetical protein